ncbi:ABC transporter ATP-binding protein [Janibacter alkaliphilus]|uniref:Iron complex transport system ATP-binding protein n=1 Tax=Janibacter alkaliphilus TaxID=1069963 RepID=A0A852XAJ5_9MICO|nr:ABC transporter ATP-binding protein [Janibacter alkaliphilus]NYG38560.1 iron complex transport system ATP-binding protein [Janibacter alkaliphilus]
MRIVAQELGWSVGERPILAGASLSVRPGALTTVLGPNGTGKTTLVHLLAGLRTPTTGQVTYDEQRLDGIAHRERARRVAVVEQQPSTGLELTVDQVVALGRIPHRRSLRGLGRGDEQACAEAMARTGTEHLAGRAWSTLSGGERQRVQLARALAQQPEVLFLDEPTNHLDLRQQLRFMETVRSLAITTVAVLHDLDLAVAHGDDAVLLSRGEVVAAGAVGDVVTVEQVREVFGVETEISEHDGRHRLRWQRVTEDR